MPIAPNRTATGRGFNEAIHQNDVTSWIRDYTFIFPSPLANLRVLRWKSSVSWEREWKKEPIVTTHNATTDTSAEVPNFPLVSTTSSRVCLPYSRSLPSSTPSFATSNPKASNLPFSFFLSFFLSPSSFPSFRPPVARHATIRSLRVPAAVPSQVMSTACLCCPMVCRRKPDGRLVLLFFFASFGYILSRSYRTRPSLPMGNVSTEREE